MQKDQKTTADKSKTSSRDRYLKGHCPDCALVNHTHTELDYYFSSFSLTSNGIEIASTYHSIAIVSANQRALSARVDLLACVPTDV